MTACEDRRGDLAAHLLGALEPEQAAGIERHLETCDDCAAEHAELAALPGLLALVPPDAAAIPPTLDGGFADRLAARAADHQRARRHRWLSVAAACVVVAGGAGAAVATLSGGSAADRFSATDSQTGVATQITLQPRTSGTSITLRITGVPNGADCTLFAVARDGRRDIAGSWHVSYTGSANVQGTTAIPEAQLTTLVVDTSAGRQLITVRVPR